MRLFVVLAILCALTVSAVGDGMYFGTRKVEARPTIPFQRAVLKFDGKEQTMLVESTLKGPEGTYGWVVPLPKKPSFLKPVNPTYVESSFQTVKPRIQPSQDFPLVPLLMALFYAAIVLTSGIRHRTRHTGTRIILFALEGLVPLVVAAVFWPVYAQSANKGVAAADAGAAKQGVRVDDYGTVGSYQVSVVSGEDGKPILNWLKERDLSVGDDALPIIDRYVKEGWCFMAAEVRKKQSGSYPPHPIKAVFPSDRLVYPMRLTGLQSEPLRLELLVISDKQASMPGLEAWACDNDPITIYVDIKSPQDEELFAGWSSGKYAMAKAGMVWTYLRGNLHQSQMRQDFEAHWQPMQRFRAEVYDAEGARNKAAGKFSLGLVVASLLIGFTLTCLAGMSARMHVIGSVISFLAAIGYTGIWVSKVHIVDTVEVANVQGKY